MVATTNLPGSVHFDYFVGTKQECRDWLVQQQEKYRQQFQGTWYSAYYPARIVSNEEAASWRYRDGSRVIEF